MPKEQSSINTYLTSLTKWKLLTLMTTDKFPWSCKYLCQVYLHLH